MHIPPFQLMYVVYFLSSRISKFPQVLGFRFARKERNGRKISLAESQLPGRALTGPEADHRGGEGGTRGPCCPTELPWG